MREATISKHPLGFFSVTILSTAHLQPTEHLHSKFSSMLFRFVIFALVLTSFIVKDEALSFLFETFPRWHTAIYLLESCTYWAEDRITYIDVFLQDIILRSGCSVWAAAKYALQNHLVLPSLLTAVRR
jgi:hypothetical protein